MTSWLTWYKSPSTRWPTRWDLQTAAQLLLADTLQQLQLILFSRGQEVSSKSWISTNQRWDFCGINQSEISIVNCMFLPIRDYYCFVSTNQRLVLFCLNQSEMSIVLFQTIRAWYQVSFMWTNQVLELLRINQSDAIITYWGLECCQCRWRSTSQTPHPDEGLECPPSCSLSPPCLRGTLLWRLEI